MSFSKILSKFNWTYDHYIVDDEYGLIHAKKFDDDDLPIGKVTELNTVGILCLVIMWYCILIVT